MLTGKEIIEKNIITNYSEEGIQQQGIDLRINRIREVILNDNYDTKIIPKQGKTIPANVTSWIDKDKFYLHKGYYEVEFIEGCNIPANNAMWLKERSSLVRCGASIKSGQFDAGFKTDNIGCFLKIDGYLTIEKGARLAQAIIFNSNDVINLYDGQWQNDIRR